MRYLNRMRFLPSILLLASLLPLLAQQQVHVVVKPGETVTVTITAPPIVPDIPPPLPEPPPPSVTGFFVDKDAADGDDSRSCAQARNQAMPKRTLTNAFGCNAPGAVFIMRGGDWSERPSRFPSGTGAADGQIVTIQNYPGEKVRIVPAGTSINGWDLRSVRYLRIRGVGGRDSLVFDCAGMTGPFGVACVKMTAVEHITFDTLTVRNSPSQGILGSTSGGPNCDVTIRNALVERNGKDINYDHGIYQKGCRWLIEDSEIRNNAGLGINVRGDASDTTTGSIYRRLRIHGHKEHCAMELGYGNNLLAENILAYKNDGGIRSCYGEPVGTKIYNSTSWDNDQGGGGSCGGRGIHVCSGAKNAEVINNISFGHSGGDIVNQGTGTVMKTNVVNPNFRNLASVPPDLWPLCCAIDAGTALPTVKTDVDGRLRPQGAAYDVGAYEQ